MRYDAGVIGAGAEGLVAAALLARAGLKTVLFERNAEIGGRLVTREFRPGYRASPFTDTVAEIPNSLFHGLDLARRGVLVIPESNSTAMWSERYHILRRSLGDDALDRALRIAQSRLAALRERCVSDAARTPVRGFFSRKPQVEAWPSSDWAQTSLSALTGEAGTDEAEHFFARALEGSDMLPDAESSALHLLLGCGAGRVAGGLGRLGAALADAARASGVEIMAGLEVSDIRQNRKRVSGVTLADGAEIELGSLISTLDLKRTFLSLFPWSALSKEVVGRAGNWRMGTGTARLLLALDQAPNLSDPALASGPVHLSPDSMARARASLACRGGVVPDTPPATLRFVSAADPALAPFGGATLTLTLGAIPYKLFDGGWTHERREALRARALELLDAVLPGLSGHVVGSELLVPSDIEEALGVSEGDLRGGEIAPDQMLGFRPWLEPGWRHGPRSVVQGLYLAGASAPAGLFGTGLSGMVAANALLADRGGRA